MPERWVALGDRAIRFARPARSARAIVHAVRGWPGVVDVVVARHDVAAYFAAPVEADPAWPAWIAALADAPDDPAPVRDVALPAIYDGPDLDDVARTLGRTRDEVAAIHAAATYTVETMGFAPGFAYLAGLPAALELPRRATPRTRVPAGSIAIAGAHTAVYPFASPGGWHLLGRVVDTAMFGPDGPRLALGDRVRFVAARG
ncbi:MAG TPA: carboxyltransferase domain-containing protein [Kofleriaceae bacterium]|nr:carboxyltransferase domain-containing protein [Kofleriaceae bacterium]